MEIMTTFIGDTLSLVANFLLQPPIIYFTCAFLLLVVVRIFKLLLNY